MPISEDKSIAIGEFYINENLVQHFVIDITQESLKKNGIEKIGENKYLYGEVLRNEKGVIVSNIKQREKEISANLNTETINLNLSIQKMKGGESRIAPLVVWGIVARVSAVTTVATCAYERTVARNACQSVYSDCNTSCDGTCSYHYKSGI